MAGIDPKIIIGMELDAKLAKAGFQTIEKSAKNLGSVLNSSVNASAKNLGIALSNVNSVVGTKLISSFEKLGRTTGSFSKVNTIFRDINGTLLQQEQIIQRITKQNRGPGGLWGRGFSEQFKVVSTGPIRPVNVDKTFGAPPKDIFADINIGKLAARAALTIPTWLALRAGIMSVLDVIPNAISRFKELDSAAAEMKVLTDGANNIQNFTNLAMGSLNKLSRELGKTPTELKAIYTAVSSTGIDATTSLSAMDTIARGAIATGADSAELAKTMAGLVNTMGDTLTVGTTKGEKFRELMAMLHSAMKTNAGSMNDFSEALAQAGSTAATSGMSLTELIANVAVLQTAMVRAGMGGTALRTALDQVVQKRGDIEKLLSRKITQEETKNQFTLILSVVERIKSLTDSGDLQKANEAMVNIFGVKAGKDVNVLRQNLVKFNGTVADLNRLTEIGRTQGLDAMLAELTKDTETRLQTLETQSKRFGQIMGEIQSSFATGLLGRSGEDWVASLTRLNDNLNKSTDAFKEFGSVLKDAAIGASIVGIGSALVGLNPILAGVGISIAAFMSSPAVIAFIAFMAAMQLYKTVTKPQNEVEAKVDKRIADSSQPFYSSGRKRQNFYEQLGKSRPELLNASMKDYKASGSTENFEDWLRKEYRASPYFKEWMRGVNSTLPKVQGATSKPAGSGNFGMSSMSLADEESFKTSLISLNSELLKQGGALTSQILIQQELDVKKLGILEQDIDKAKRRLDLAKALTEETKLQSRLGSTSLKLFEIAKTSGVDVARKLGEVLQGQVDFSSFIRGGGPATEVFKKEFADLFTAKQAEAFYKGENIPGFQSPVVGMAASYTSGFSGTSIPIDEKFLREPLTSATDLLTGQYDAIMQPHLQGLAENTSVMRELTSALRTLISGPKADYRGSSIRPSMINSDMIEEVVASRLEKSGSRMQQGLQVAQLGRDASDFNTSWSKNFHYGL